MASKRARRTTRSQSMAGRAREDSTHDSTKSSSGGNKRQKRESSKVQQAARRHPRPNQPEDAKPPDTHHSKIIGGLRGGYRVTADDDDDDDDDDAGVLHFQIPSSSSSKGKKEQKMIVCQYWGLPASRARESKRAGHAEKDGSAVLQQLAPSLLFTHGAGGGISNPATRSFVKGYSDAMSRSETSGSNENDASGCVVAVQGTMNLSSRVSTFKDVIQYFDAATVPNNVITTLGGRSMGARAAVQTTLDQLSNGSNSTNLRNLILVSYPLNGPKDTRDAPLLELPPSISVLFITGSNDQMCPLEDLKRLMKTMKASTWALEINGADHAMSLGSRKALSTGTGKLREQSGSIARDWVHRRNTGTGGPGGTKEKRWRQLKWHEEREESHDTGWTA